MGEALVRSAPSYCGVRATSPHRPAPPLTLKEPSKGVMANCTSESTSYYNASSMLKSVGGAMVTKAVLTQGLLIVYSNE